MTLFCSQPLPLESFIRLDLADEASYQYLCIDHVASVAHGDSGRITMLN